MENVLGPALLVIFSSACAGPSAVVDPPRLIAHAGGIGFAHGGFLPEHLSEHGADGRPRREHSEAVHQGDPEW